MTLSGAPQKYSPLTRFGSSPRTLLVSTWRGYLTSVACDRPVEALRTSSITPASMPKVFATVRTSPAAARFVAESRLFSALAACPAPAGPTTCTVIPNGSRCGRARSTSGGAPPTMMDSSPVTALATPPETGAST